jgi:hypothetical protein
MSILPVGEQAYRLRFTHYMAAHKPMSWWKTYEVIPRKMGEK